MTYSMRHIQWGLTLEFVTDNCCIAADGIHFVFNEYSIAPFLEGVIEAVVRHDGKISVTQYGNTPKFAERP